MTKYILAGGNDRQFEAYGLQLAEEIYKTVARPAKILSCFFADPEPRQWEVRVRDWEPWLKRYFGNDIAYERALPDTFPDQIKAHDVVYLHGGDNEAILSRMRAYPNLWDAFEGKVVVGSSAGANYLSQKFWTRSKSQVGEGTGLVPVSTMVHYGSKDGGFNNGPIDWVEADAKMRAAAGSGQILRLREGEFTVIEP